jgi:hypothetical protein
VRASKRELTPAQGLPPKKFYDEIYPLALFVKYELAGTPDAMVTPNLNNDHFDATIFFGKSSRTLYVEVTCTLESSEGASSRFLSHKYMLRLSKQYLFLLGKGKPVQTSF